MNRKRMAVAIALAVLGIIAAVAFDRQSEAPPAYIMGDSSDPAQHLTDVLKRLETLFSAAEANRLLGIYRDYLQCEMELANESALGPTPVSPREALEILANLQDVRRKVFDEGKRSGSAWRSSKRNQNRPLVSGAGGFYSQTKFPRRQATASHSMADDDTEAVTVEFTYDSRGNLESITDPLGHATLFMERCIYI